MPEVARGGALRGRSSGATCPWSVVHRRRPLDCLLQRGRHQRREDPCCVALRKTAQAISKNAPYRTLAPCASGFRASQGMGVWWIAWPPIGAAPRPWGPMREQQAFPEYKVHGCRRRASTLRSCDISPTGGWTGASVGRRWPRRGNKAVSRCVRNPGRSTDRVEFRVEPGPSVRSRQPGPIADGLGHCRASHRLPARSCSLGGEWLCTRHCSAIDRLRGKRHIRDHKKDGMMPQPTVPTQPVAPSCPLRGINGSRPGGGLLVILRTQAACSRALRKLVCLRTLRRQTVIIPNLDSEGLIGEKGGGGGARLISVQPVSSLWDGDASSCLIWTTGVLMRPRYHGTKSAREEER